MTCGNPVLTHPQTLSSISYEKIETTFYDQKSFCGQNLQYLTVKSFDFHFFILNISFRQNLPIATLQLVVVFQR